MTVGWAWLGSRVCLAKEYWHGNLFIFFIGLKNTSHIKRYFEVS
jgi:hypothetical protein